MSMSITITQLQLHKWELQLQLLCAAVTICSTLVNIQTNILSTLDTQTDSILNSLIWKVQPAELKTTTYTLHNYAKNSYSRDSNSEVRGLW